MNTSPAYREWRQGWPVVLSGLLGYGCGSSFFLIASSLFIAPMQADLGWSVKALTIMPIVVFLLAICNPVAGLLLDRWGARPVVVVGLILYAAGTIGLAVAPMTPVRSAARRVGDGGLSTGRSRWKPCQSKKKTIE